MSVCERDVLQYMSACDHCQRNKASIEKPAGLLQPLPVPEFGWQWVTVDFITDLPETKAGHTAIVVFVDRLTRWCILLIAGMTWVLRSLLRSF